MTATSKITFSKSFKCYLEKDIDIEYCVKLETIAKELMGFDDFLKKKILFYITFENAIIL